MVQLHDSACKKGMPPRCKLFRIGNACCVVDLPRFSPRLPWGCRGPLPSVWCPLCINVDYIRFYAVFRLFCAVFRCFDGAGACLKTQKGNFSRVYVRFVVRAALVCTIHCTPGPCPSSAPLLLSIWPVGRGARRVSVSNRRGLPRSAGGCAARPSMGGDMPGPARCRRCARRCPSRCSIKVQEKSPAAARL